MNVWTLIGFVLLSFGLTLALARGGEASATSSTSPTTSPTTAAERARIEAVTRLTDDFSEPEPFEVRPGGAATSFKTLNRHVFSHASANLPLERELDFKVGNGIFKKLWVSAPSSTASSDGLGPLYNARACQHCHIKDGRGRPPAEGEAAVSMLVRLSIPPQDEAQRKAIEQRKKSVIPDPVYGGQLQGYSVPGLLGEGELVIAYEEIPVTLGDGTVVQLRKPTYRFEELNYGPMHPEVMMSPRVAPPVIGMGLLEAIPDAAILAHADPDDADGDGISGRPNWVWSDEHDKVMLGRFGWKAGQPTVAQQSAAAFSGDMGISTPLYPAAYGDCTPAQGTCLDAPHGGASESETVEAGDEMFETMLFYARNLAVPARRDVGKPQVLKGKQLFYETGCIGCHVPKYVTLRDSIGEEQSFQLIWPYSDLLLHDMGEGLADGRPDGVAGGQEWRTPPLWGIGLTETVSGHTLFLHDGRARNRLEALLWHGGEAEAAKEGVVAMSKSERDALLAFLNSL